MDIRSTYPNVHLLLSTFDLVSPTEAATLRAELRPEVFDRKDTTLADIAAAVSQEVDGPAAARLASVAEQIGTMQISLIAATRVFMVVHHRYANAPAAVEDTVGASTAQQVCAVLMRWHRQRTLLASPNAGIKRPAEVRYPKCETETVQREAAAWECPAWPDLARILSGRAPVADQSQDWAFWG